ncbi:hypothetical protein CIB84_017004, partial [Bambusicola thoracicus]
LQRGDACRHFGSLVGLLAPLMCDPMPTSHQLAVTCLSSLLRIQAEATNGVIKMGDIRSLGEGLNDRSIICQLQTSSKIAQVSGPKKDCWDLNFMMAIKDTFRKAKGTRVRAAGRWMITFLQMFGKDICRHVPLTTYILHGCRSSPQQSTFMPFLTQVVVNPHSLSHRHHE